ncbi:MAG: Transcriptional regulatory protein ZraR [bacterium]|nr:Transcriptional regulatory protein ZraR [bacterium]
MRHTSEKHTILIIDDDPDFVEALRALAGEEFHLFAATSGEEGLRQYSANASDLVLLDLKLGRGIDGLETLRRLKRLDPDVPVIMITEHVALETARQAGQLGAAHFCDKALSLKEIRLVINQHLHNLPWRRAYRDAMQRQMHPFIGNSPVVQRLFADLDIIAPADRPVLITGESGSGKELIAQQIHRKSARAHHPLLIVNCSNLSPELFESEFFGHEKGAFTTALQTQKGKFEQADGCTLFLDEIADLPLAAQPKILRAIEYGTFSRVGGQREQHADVRLLAATNQNLEDAVKAGKFRHDLFYRLNHLRLHVPPLRERRDDIPLLVQYYLHYHSVTLHRSQPEIPADLMETWQRYDWPGNVRELSTEIENLVLFSRNGKIDRARLRIPVSNQTASPDFFEPFFTLPYEAAKENVLTQFQQAYVRHLVVQHEGNLSRAAEAAGINRSTIYRLLNSSSPHPDDAQEN